MFVQALMEDLRINNSEQMLFSRFKMPTNDISIVREHNGERFLQTASWWLLQQTTYDGFKPSRFTSFNTRYDKLNQPNSAGYNAFRESRCIVIAKGFGETEKSGSSSVYHDFVAEDAAIAFGGLFREWHHPRTGERVAVETELEQEWLTLFDELGWDDEALSGSNNSYQIAAD